MFKNLLILFGILFFNLSLAYSIESVPFNCTYEQNSNPIGSGFQTLFSTSADLSAQFSVDPLGYFSPSTGYGGYQVRCNAANDNGFVTFEIKDKPSNAVVCGEDINEIMYFTGDTNARVSRSYDSTFHTKVLCANFDQSNGVMHLVWNDKDLTSRDYACLFKTNDVNNGLASSCGADYNSGDQYLYSVWGILFDSIDSLNCKADCSSKLDNRIYSICSAKIKSCSDVPLDCDGSLYGSWVKSTDVRYPNSEIQCSAPWNNYRTSKFTNTTLQITTVNGACENLIKIEYPFILDDEQIKMGVYVCSD
jgi:hypothetical protein